ncbi:hypothetical protein ACQJBY_057657 [Aegilops geniculata]
MEEEEDDFDESVHYHEFADPIFVSDEEEDGAGGDETGEDGARGDETGEDGAEEEEENVEVASKRKLTSTVWAEFKRVKVAGKWKAKCVYCSKELGGEPKNGTKHLHYHLGICVLKKIKTKGKTLSQSSLRFGSASQGKVNVENYTFDQDLARKELASMIVVHEYPLSIVDHAGFRRFVSALQPLFKMVTRNTIRKDIVNAYKAERKKAIEYMAGNKSRVAITTDMWAADNQKKGYMAITGHFIDDSWKLRSVIMRFIYVPAPHTGEVIAEELHETLISWNLDEKLSAVTVDNCTTNDKTVELLVTKIGKTKFMLKGTLLHMRCCAHILNLIVKDGLDAMKPAIEKVRDSVAFWTATPKRVEKFEEIAKYQKVKITRRLTLDCKTRWNSTFTMLSVALPYRSIFARLKKVEKQYESLPSDEEWDFATHVVERLRLFFDITALFSRTDYVTANIYFPKICEIKMNMRQWSTCGNAVIEAMSASMTEKFNKYWTDIQSLMGMATILDPRYKNEMLLVCFAMLHGVNVSSAECEGYVAELVAKLCKLLEEYSLEKDDDESAPSSSFSSMQAPALMSLFNERVAQKRPTASRMKSELDRYLEDELVLVSQDKFNVLDWWKVAGTRYPTLRMLARDIFAIPVSTVASESAFSTSGRVLCDHRCSLTPEMLETLMCSQDWIRNKYKDGNNANSPSFWTCLQDNQEVLPPPDLESCA